MTASWNPLIAHRALGWLGPAVGAPARLVASRLVSHADREGRSHPSIARLAHETGLSDRTVQRALTQLRGLGIVTWLSAFDPATGRHGANRYRVSMTALLMLEAAERRRHPAQWCQPDTGGGGHVTGSGVPVANDLSIDQLTTKEAAARARVRPAAVPANDGPSAAADSKNDSTPNRPELTEQPPEVPEAGTTQHDARPSPHSLDVTAKAVLQEQDGLTLDTITAAWRAAHGARYGRTPPPTDAGDELLLRELLAQAGDELARAGLGRSDPGAPARVVGRILRAYLREDGSRETYREGFLTAKRHALKFLRGERKRSEFLATALGAEARAVQHTRTRSAPPIKARGAPCAGDVWGEALEHIHAAAAGPPVPRLRFASGGT